MNDDRPKIQTTDIKVVYSNPWLIVEEHKVRNIDNSAGIYGVLDYGNGVTTIAVNNNNEILLINEYKYAIEQFAYQLPSGGVEKGEDALEAAKREFLEESGLQGEKWQSLGYIYPFPTNIKTKVNLYLVTNVIEVQRPENGVDSDWFSVDEVREMIQRNEIIHAGSLVCLLKYLSKL